MQRRHVGQAKFCRIKHNSQSIIFNDNMKINIDSKRHLFHANACKNEAKCIHDHLLIHGLNH